ncbi:uncharacterized protein PAC_09819 [Phialocephala subalpina]|uniref:F-box domain-containing protein n=1 Tax=Phialocephala subalpina TaxID=576137 RepID=A0A1L7X4I3_9HELO|nr:uncharacterized protein PAC_09819 [Phialocephala subalpina]
MASQTLWQRLPRCSLWDLLGDMYMPVLELLSLPELHVLSLVSKASRASCEPLLYSSIEWTWLEDRPPPITAFIRTILRRPELAAHVRSLSLLGDSFIPYHEDRDTIPPRIDIAALDYKDAAKVIEQTKVHFAVSWEKQLSQGAMDALTTLLLSQLHHVTHLVLGPIFTFETALLRQLFYAALFKQTDHELPTYQHLRKLYLNFSARLGRSIYSLKSTDLLPFFYLPVVQELSVVSSMPMSWGEWPMQAPTSSVLTLLHLTAIEPKHLGHLLSMTPALKKLRYDWYYRSGVNLGRPEEGSVLVNLDDISRALEHVRETLEELVITGKCSIEEFYEYDFLDFQGTLKGIVDLGCLKTLQIPLPFLTGEFNARHAIAVDDVIPRNLEVLTITDDVLLEWPWEPEWEDTVVSSAIGRWYVLEELVLSILRVSNVLETYLTLPLKHPRFGNC